MTSEESRKNRVARRAREMGGADYEDDPWLYDERAELEERAREADGVVNPHSAEPCLGEALRGAADSLRRLAYLGEQDGPNELSRQRRRHAHLLEVLYRAMQRSDTPEDLVAMIIAHEVKRINGAPYHRTQFQEPAERIVAVLSTVAAERESRWEARMQHLLNQLPSEMRHRLGGDWREMVEGLDAGIQNAGEGAAAL